MIRQAMRPLPQVFQLHGELSVRPWPTLSASAVSIFINRPTLAASATKTRCVAQRSVPSRPIRSQRNAVLLRELAAGFFADEIDLKQATAFVIL
jgi:hypothetical protein